MGAHFLYLQKNKNKFHRYRDIREPSRMSDVAKTLSDEMRLSTKCLRRKDCAKYFARKYKKNYEREICCLKWADYYRPPR